MHLNTSNKKQTNVIVISKNKYIWRIIGCRGEKIQISFPSECNQSQYLKSGI